MNRPYLVIKQHAGDYFHHDYANIDEALAACNQSANFPGELICVYNLQTRRYETIEGFPGGVNEATKEIIADYQNR